MDTPKWDWKSTLGPGICMAGAAIGVSHLMQATRAGAEFGWSLLALVVLVNLVKYPFFEYGHRYASATGEHLLEGYLRLGKPTLVFYFLLNIVTAIGSISGVTFLTAALASYLAGGALNLFWWSVILLAVCAAIIALGHYRLVDGAVKVIVAFLILATTVAFVAALVHGPVGDPPSAGPTPWSLAGMGFLVALMGWMPAPIEISVLQSLWMKANDRDHKRAATRWADARKDFNIGYGLMLLTALMFLGLGALVMHGTGVAFAAGNAGFTRQLIQLYTENLGGWARPVIALAAFSAMFSTTLTVLDGYPRSLAYAAAVLAKGKGGTPSTPAHLSWIGFGAGGAALVLYLAVYRGMGLTGLIDVVTTIAFLAAPFFAFWNHRLIYSEHLPEAMRPGKGMRAFSRFGLVFLIGFGLVFIVSRFL